MSEIAGREGMSVDAISAVVLRERRRGVTFPAVSPPNVVRARERARRYIAMRSEGLLNVEIARRDGVSTASVASLLHNAKRWGFEVPPSPYRPRGSIATPWGRATPREAEFIAARVEGLTNVEIAARFGVSIGNVGNRFVAARRRGVDVPIGPGRMRRSG